MADTEQLIVLLEAKVDAFEKNMKRASKTADTSFKSIEDRAKRSAAQLEKSMQQAASGVVGAFKSNFLSAAGLSGLGVTALVASLAKINSELAKIPGLAREAGLSTNRLQEIKFAGAVKEVGDEDFIASLRSSMSLLDEAQRNVNSLSRLFAANGVAIRDQNGELIKFDRLLENAARLMAGTKIEQEKIKIADMLGLSREWIAVLRDGPEEFRKSAAAATEAGAVLDKEILNKAKQFDREWNASLVKFKAGFVSALTDIAGSFQGLFGVISKLGELGTTALSKLAKGGLGEIGANLLKTGKGTALSTDVDSLYGGLLPSAASSGAGSAGKSTVIPREKQDDPFRSALFDAQKRIAQVEAETRAIGLNSEARERAKLMADLESAAKKANSEAGFQNATITEAQRKKIEELGAAMEAAARKQRMSHEALQQFAVDSMDSIAQFDSLAISAFGNLENSMVSFIDGSKNAKEAFADMTKSILSDLTRMMIRMSITGPLAKGLAGLLTGGLGGGVAAAVQHSGYGPGDPLRLGMAPAGAFIGAPRYHSGIGPNERAAIIRKDESVLTPGQMRAMGRVGPGTGAVTISPVVNVSMPQGGKPEDGNRFGAEISRAIVSAVQSELVNQRRQGGLLRR